MVPLILSGEELKECETIEVYEIVQSRPLFVVCVCKAGRLGFKGSKERLFLGCTFPSSVSFSRGGVFIATL